MFAIYKRPQPSPSSTPNRTRIYQPIYTHQTNHLPPHNVPINTSTIRSLNGKLSRTGRSRRNGRRGRRGRMMMRLCRWVDVW